MVGRGGAVEGVNNNPSHAPLCSDKQDVLNFINNNHALKEKKNGFINDRLGGLKRDKGVFHIIIRSQVGLSVSIRLKM